jgi:sulfonate transport system permease protein
MSAEGTVFVPASQSTRLRLRPKLIRFSQFALGPVLLLAVWYVVNATGLVDQRLLPSPLQTIRSLINTIGSGAMLTDVGSTMNLVLQAFGLGAGLAIPVGLVLGSSASIYRSADFLIDFFRSTPATALFPLFMLIFGLSDFSKVSIAAFTVWLVVVFNVAQGVLNARRTRILAAKSMGASHWRLFKDVIFFETLPQTFVGLRTGISMSLVVIIVGEMFIGSSSGLGHRIIDAQISYRLADMYGSILVCGVLGYLLNYVLISLERNFVHWAGR